MQGRIRDLLAELFGEPADLCCQRIELTLNVIAAPAKLFAFLSQILKVVAHARAFSVSKRGGLRCGRR